jgi:hypothetical protein
MPQLKPLHSDAGFAVAENTIIDASRNVVSANSVEVVNSSFTTSYKKEFITYNTANDTSSTVSLNNFESIISNRICFSAANALLTWKGYPIGSYTVNTNESLVTVTLSGHGLSAGNFIDVIFDQSFSAQDGTYNVVEVLSPSIFTFDTGTIFDPINPIVNSILEISSYGDTWEYSIKLETTILSDAANNLTISGIAKTITKENIPPGHSWNIIPQVNNSNQTFGYQVAISSNGTLENYSDGVKATAHVSNVLAVRQ